MVARTALNLLYPSQCVSCGVLVEGDHGLCGSCWSQTPFIAGAICDCCGTPLMGPDPDERAICDECMEHPRPWDKGRAALIYTGEARRMVLGLKHAGKEDVATPAGYWMAQAGREILSPESLLVPIPLHWLRLFRRRYNQAVLLARAVARETGAELAVDALTRPKRTPPLGRMTREERDGVLKDTIVPNPRRQVLEGRNVVLIDDVMTSGATLAAATEAAHKGGAARVDVLALARRVRDP